MRILPTICVHIWSVSRVSSHSAAGGSDGQRSAANTDSPWAVAGLDRRHGAAGCEIDHRDIIGQTIRGVQRLLVTAERESPRPRAGGDGLHDAIGHCINLYYSVAAAGRGVDALSVAGDGDTDRMVDRPQLDAMKNAPR